MKKAIADKWVAALRSGQYKQTRGKLRSTRDGFCCLGVLCNLHAQQHPKIAAREIDKLSYLGEECFLPYQVQKWAGVHDNAGQLSSYAGRPLSELNDESKWPFAKIADYIEANYKLL